MIKYLLNIFVCVNLWGCLGTNPVIPPAVPSLRTVKFSDQLLQDCKDLPKLKSSNDTDIKDHVSSVVELYVTCATNKRLENIEVKKAFNIP